MNGSQIKPMSERWEVKSQFEKRPEINGEAWVYRVSRGEIPWGILVDERIPSKTLFKPSVHSHPDWDEAIIPLDGLYWVKVGDFERCFSPGEIAFIPGGQEHDSGIATNLAGTWFLVILIHSSLHSFAGISPGGVQLPPGCLSWLKGAFRYLRQDQTERGFIPLSILPEFLRKVASGNRLDRDLSHPDPIVTQIIRLLEQPDTPALGELANCVGLTVSHFQRRFTKALGCSPLHYARAWKLDRIADLLHRDSESPLVDIATEYGFGDMKHFRQLFHRRFGITPGAYRKNPPPSSNGPLLDKNEMVRETTEDL